MRSVAASFRLLILALVLGSAAHGQEPYLSRKDLYKRCVLSALVGSLEDLKSISNEDAYLSSFDVRSIVPKTAESLSDFENVVLKVSDSAGRSYVIRRTMSYQGSKTSDVQFEHFSNLFARDIPGIHVPALRVLSQKDSRALISNLKAKGHIIDDPMEGTIFDDAKLSVTPFYHAELGRDYLNELGISGELRDRIIHYPHYLQGQPANDVKIELVQAWLDSSPSEKKAIREDLAILVPRFRKVSDKNFPGALMKHFDTLMTDKVSKGLTVRSWYRIPEDVRTQLANHWAVYEALGIDDFHSGNWMIKNGTVIGIDLAQQTTHFDSGSAFTGHRFAGFKYDLDFGKPVLQMLFKASISPKTRNYLLSLTEDKIRDIAARANFPIDDHQIRGILSRITAICKRP